MILEKRFLSFVFLVSSVSYYRIAKAFQTSKFSSKSSKSLEIFRAASHLLASVSNHGVNDTTISLIIAKKPKNKKNDRRSKVSHTHIDYGARDEELSEHLQSVYGSDRSPRAKTQRNSKINPNANVKSEAVKHHMEHMKKFDNLPCLVLNADYQPLSYLPLSLWSWQDTIKAVFSDKVTVVETYPDVHVHAVNVKFELPSVIALNDFISKNSQRQPAFSRRNVFLRDGYTCQYCTKKFLSYDLSFDHVVPRSKGGKLSWENVVTCCHKCNGMKGSSTLEEIRRKGMKLMRKPRVPTVYDLAVEAEKLSATTESPKRLSKYHDTWIPYLGILTSTSSDASGNSR